MLRCYNSYFDIISHIISVMASSFFEKLISCIHVWFCIKQDQFTKKAPRSALSQKRILMMVSILRYTRIYMYTVALLLQTYASSFSNCILPSVVNVTTLVLSMFNVYFFFCKIATGGHTKKNPHCIKFEKCNYQIK